MDELYQLINILSNQLTPWITVIVSVTLSLLAKDIISSYTKGVLFRLNSHFNEGDIVYLDGEKAIIIKMGFLESVFSVENDKGKIWRIVPNDRISYLRMERIIESNIPKHNDTVVVIKDSGDIK